jgi:UDP-GlcNAc:undecaprenyl-phosphate/decaprenyl-phosphate GlcNAc-1-phosphate transferase
VTAPPFIAVGAAAAVGAMVSWVLIRRSLRTAVPPDRIRVNVSGREVPVLLGMPLVAGAVAGLCMAVAVLRLAGDRPPLRVLVAFGIVVAPLWLAGSWDDRRGDEVPRGFTGHLGAARRLHLTGGIVKLLVGAVAGLVAGAIVGHGALEVIEVGLAIALSANLINLLDRAPGRAGKVALLAMVPLAVFGAAAWTLATSGLAGALVGALPSDLRERAMLGDEGANPLGGAVGLGVAVSLPEAWLAVVILALLALNLASERWSFSRAIERLPILDAFDRIGRR